MPRRILALWFPSLPTDRIHRRATHPAENPPPVVVADDRGGRRLVVAVDDRAAALGLLPGQALADARAVCPTVAVHPADPGGDARALAALADWCDRYTPLVAMAGADGLFLDITGSAHLFGGEAGLARDLLTRLAGFGTAVRLAVADTPGAAWAVARVGPAAGWSGGRLGDALLAPGTQEAALAGLAVAGLRLEPAVIAGLEQAGLTRIGDLYACARGPLTARFGRHLLQRLDQALGSAGEAIDPRVPAAPQRVLLRFAEPLGRHEDIVLAIERAAHDLCRALERRGDGVGRIELTLWLVDGRVVRRRIATSQPTRHAPLIVRLLAERLDSIDAGFGVETLGLAARETGPLAPEQADFTGDDAEVAALGELIDRLRVRLGNTAVWQPGVRESYWPERMVARRPVDLVRRERRQRTAPASAREAVSARGATLAREAASARARPVRLLAWPEPVEAIAPVPDDPPLAFRWQGAAYRVARADGPERLVGEWWREAQPRPPRDYYRVEDTTGRRFWLYREGAYAADTASRWFLHGLFA